MPSDEPPGTTRFASMALLGVGTLTGLQSGMALLVTLFGGAGLAGLAVLVVNLAAAAAMVWAGLSVRVGSRAWTVAGVLLAALPAALVVSDAVRRGTVLPFSTLFAVVGVAVVVALVSPSHRAFVREVTAAA